MAFIIATKRCHQVSTCSDIIKGTSQQTCYLLRFQVPEMARLSWMTTKFTRGMTYQWKAKDLANAWEYLYGVANIVIQRYNEDCIMNDF